MARVGGDTDDLPQGWEVDEDNWARRKRREGDVELKALTANVESQCFIGDDGYIYAMSSWAAHIYDRASDS
jgi:hypothetical protein